MRPTIQAVVGLCLGAWCLLPSPVAAQDRTLSSEEVGQIRAGIIEKMREAGFELRV